MATSNLMLLAFCFALALASCTGCCTRFTPAVAAKPQADEYANTGAAMSACLDVQDHLVGLYADEYITSVGGDETIAPAERAAFRDAWAEQLEKRGTFDRFDVACFASVKPSSYKCAMGAGSSDDAIACLRWGAK